MRVRVVDRHPNSCVSEQPWCLQLRRRTGRVSWGKSEGENECVFDYGVWEASPASGEGCLTDHQNLGFGSGQGFGRPETEVLIKTWRWYKGLWRRGLWPETGVGWGIAKGEWREKVMKIMREGGPGKTSCWKPRDKNFAVKRLLMALHAWQRTVGDRDWGKDWDGTISSSIWPWGGQIHGHVGNGGWARVAGMGRYSSLESCATGREVDWFSGQIPSPHLGAFTAFPFSFTPERHLNHWRLPWEFLGIAVPPLAWISKIQHFYSSLQYANH